MGFNFTAIDFETANHHRGSPCAVGLARVRDNAVVDSAIWLMKPPPQYAGFEPYNISVHHISSSTVANERDFEAVLPDILGFVGADIVVAHNARFDSSVLAAATIAIGIEPPRLRYLCTLIAARRCLELPSYRLPFVGQALGVELHDPNSPGGGAAAAAAILPRLADRLGVADLEQMARVIQAAPAPRTLPTTDRPNPDADRDHPLWGRVVVFTGALSSMTRPMAHDECIRVGALPEKTVTKRTNVLVVGDLDPARLVPGDVTSQKAQKAFHLRATGQDIEVVTEYDFLQLI